MLFSETFNGNMNSARPLQLLILWSYQWEVQKQAGQANQMRGWNYIGTDDCNCTGVTSLAGNGNQEIEQRCLLNCLSYSKEIIPGHIQIKVSDILQYQLGGKACVCVVNIVFQLAGTQKRIYNQLGSSFEKPSPPPPPRPAPWWFVATSVSVSFNVSLACG